MQGSVIGLDHVQFWCGNAQLATNYWSNTLGFQHIATQRYAQSPKRTSHVLSQGKVKIMFTSSVDSKDEEFFQHLRVHGDSVKDVALEVNNVDQIFKQAVDAGATSLELPHDIQDTNGSVRIAKIGTPFGDVIHTLIERRGYAGTFLPQFQTIQKSQKDEGIVCVDHVAIAFRKGKSSEAMEWYSKCLGFHHFICSEDDTQDGMEVNSKNTMEGGLKTIVAACNQDKFCFKFVLVEAIEGTYQNQVEEFLEYNGGNGVQHIALHSRDIFETVSNLKKKGLDFLKVPSTYYEMLFTSPDQHFFSVKEKMEDLGLLVECTEAMLTGDQPHFFMQCFTLPFFQDRPTFFLEIIQRQGSEGFGKRTIKTLFEAVEKQRKKRDQNK
jgi:4-hydroxyphenylpyruvate dioxygenase